MAALELMLVLYVIPDPILKKTGKPVCLWETAERGGDGGKMRNSNL